MNCLSFFLFLFPLSFPLSLFALHIPASSSLSLILPPPPQRPPIFLLNFVGGYSTHPSFFKLCSNVKFISTVFLTHYIAQNSNTNDKRKFIFPLVLNLAFIRSIPIFILSLYFMFFYYVPYSSFAPICKNAMYAFTVSSLVYISGGENPSAFTGTLAKIIFCITYFLDGMIDIRKMNMRERDISMISGYTLLSLGVVDGIVKIGETHVFMPYYLYFMSISCLFHGILCKFQNYSEESINRLVNNTNRMLYVYLAIVLFLM